MPSESGNFRRNRVAPNYPSILSSPANRGAAEALIALEPTHLLTLLITPQLGTHPPGIVD